LQQPKKKKKKKVSKKKVSVNEDKENPTDELTGPTISNESSDEEETAPTDLPSHCKKLDTSN
jgi:hypothetical protein